MNFQGKRIVVTGGGSGIGSAISKALAEAGASVVITGRDQGKLDATAASHPGISGQICDGTRNEDVIALREMMDAGGGTDILINNAGVMHAFDVTGSFPLEKQLQEIAIDAAGPVRMIHHFLPGMLKRESAVIVNVSSGLAYVPFASAPIYSGSKSFVHAYTICLRSQLANTLVRVVELLPPVVDTPMTATLDWPKMPQEKLVADFMRGLRRGHDEITPGQSLQLKWLGRLLPGFIFGQLNKKPFFNS